MSRLVLRRMLATIGALLAIAAACLQVWWFHGFTRVYFPDATIVGEIPTLVACIAALGYFVAVTWTGRWSPWRRHD